MEDCDVVDNLSFEFLIQFTGGKKQAAVFLISSISVFYDRQCLGWNSIEQNAFNHKLSTIYLA